MRALIVLPYPPTLEGRAAARCAVGLVRGLVEQGIECNALAADLRPQPSPAPPADLPVEVVHLELPSRGRDRLDRLARPGGVFRRGLFAARLRTLAREHDIVHFSDPEAAVNIGLVDAPAVVQIHNLTSRDRAIGAPWRRDGRIALELLRSEMLACRRARWLVANSEEIAGPLRAKAPHAHVEVAPLALDPVHYAPPAALEHAVAGLIGTARWAPTKSAVRRLITRVWPLVLERRPGSRLMLAGEDMERSAFPDLPDLPGVQWRGSVPTATGFLGELGLLLYPLGAGSGAKIKVLEAMALGLPVVTTPEGAEGLGSRAGVAVETADERIADAAVALLDDLGARRAAGTQARESFMRHHTPMVAAAPVVKLYERMLA